MSSLLRRTLTGAVFVVVVAGAVFWNEYSFLALLLVISTVGLYEFYRLMPAYVSPQRIPAFLLLGILFAYTVKNIDREFFEIGFWIIMISLLPVFFLVMVFTELFRKNEHPFLNVASSLAGWVYVVPPLIMMGSFSQYGGSYNPWLVMSYFFILWANDTGAYLTGITMGRTPFFPRISPKKTWEGAIGGTLFAAGVGYLVSRYVTGLKTADWIIIAFIIAVTATLGDLAESMLKRSAGVKDSGNILPGHGGILDRFDGLLGSAPFVWLYLSFFR